MAKKQSSIRHYDLEGTRILKRAEKAYYILLKEAKEKYKGEPENIAQIILSFIQDLLLLRIFEENFMLPTGFLKKVFEKEGLSRLIELEEQLNLTMGIRIFSPERFLELKPIETLFRGLVNELYQQRYFPKNPSVFLLSAFLEKVKRNGRGEFFTPIRIVEMMLEHSLEMLLPRKQSIEDLEFYILDPAMGGGNFIISAFKLVLEYEERFYATRPSGLFYPLIRLPDLSRALEPKLRIKILSEHFFGVEISADAVLTTQKALLVPLLKGVNLLGDEISKDGLNLNCIFENFQVGDSLIDEKLSQQIELFERPGYSKITPFDWKEKSKPHGRIVSNGGFHLVVGNPPWVSLKGKRKTKFYPKEVVEWLIEKYGADSYRPNMFELFIRRAIELTRENGINCFIVPDRMAENRQFENLRKFMAENGEILRLHFREPFPGIISDTLIYWFKKKKRAHLRKILITTFEGTKAEITKKRFLKDALSGLEKKPDEAVLSLRRKIERNSKPLKEFFTCQVGLISSPGAITVQRETESQLEILKGENIKPYRVEGNFYFDYNPRNLAGGTIRYSKLTAKEKLLLRKTGSRLICAIDRTGRLVEQSAYFMILRARSFCKKYALEYFLGLLNSEVMNYYYREFLVTNPKSTPQLKKFHLEKFPIRKIDFKNPQELKLYQAIVKNVNERAQITEDEDNAKALEDELNILVAKLYGLDENEQKMIFSVEEV